MGCVGTFFRSHHLDTHLLLAHSLESVVQGMGDGEGVGLRLSCGEVLEV